MTLANGTVVDQYRVESRLGAGAMGEVYLAVDEQLGRRVALKILSEPHRENLEIRARFVREARAVAAISHANVVQVFSIGEHDGRPYLAMEYLRGEDLMAIVRREGRLDSRRAAGFVRDAARGLEAAAAAGLIHRDVKPSNLMLLDSGVVKVTDFGLAKPVDEDADAALTATGVVVGTPDYIAPEQARGEPLDHRADIYALGCTLFVLLAGRPPYRKGLDENERYLRVVSRHLREAAPDPRREPPLPQRAPLPVDDALAELQLAMMAKRAEDRPTYPEIIARADAIVSRLDAPALPARSARITLTPSELRLDQDITRLGMSGAPLSRRGPQRSGALGLLTAISLGTFVTGLVMLGRASSPGAPADTIAPVILEVDGGAPEPPLDAGQPAPAPSAPVAPPGMLLVSGPELDEPFFVARQAVSHAEYARWRPTHRFAPVDSARPATGVPYADAVAYARAQGGRLVRAEEWDAAITTPSFVPAGMRLWEWVDEGDGERKLRAVRGVGDLDEFRRASGDRTVTFRLARDVPGAPAERLSSPAPSQR